MVSKKDAFSSSWSRISQRRFPTPEEGVPTYNVTNFFAKNYMKMKEIVCLWFCSRGGCVSLGTGVVYTPQADTPQTDFPPPRDSHYSERYASHWNSFLLNVSFTYEKIQ